MTIAKLFFFHIFTVAFLLFLAPAEGSILWGTLWPLLNPSYHKKLLWKLKKKLRFLLKIRLNILPKKLGHYKKNPSNYPSIIDIHYP